MVGLIEGFELLQLLLQRNVLHRQPLFLERSVRLRPVLCLTGQPVLGRIAGQLLLLPPLRDALTMQ